MRQHAFARIIIFSTLFSFPCTPLWAKGFGNPVVYPAGTIPHGVAVGDFNGDGNLDIAVANSQSNNVSILLGVGDGTFLPPINYPVGDGPEAVTVACSTLAGGAPLNLAVSNYIGYTVSVLIGKGDGTFQPAVTYDLGNQTIPAGIVGTLDFNHDGNCDLAVADGGGGTTGNGGISVFLGNGDGTFEAAVNYDTLGIQPNGLAAADFNNDQSADVAVSDAGSADVTVFLNDGNGGFTANAKYAVGTTPFGLTTYGSADLVVTSFSGGYVSRLHGNGDGTFINVRNYRIGGNPSGISQGLLNGDSTDDIVVTDGNGENLWVFLGRPAPQNGFRAPINFASCGAPHSVVAYDFNHDGKTDLAVACSNGVGILLNTSP